MQPNDYERLSDALKDARAARLAAKNGIAQIKESIRQLKQKQPRCDAGLAWYQHPRLKRHFRRCPRNARLGSTSCYLHRNGKARIADLTAKGFVEVFWLDGYWDGQTYVGRGYWPKAKYDALKKAQDERPLDA